MKVSASRMAFESSRIALVAALVGAAVPAGAAAQETAPQPTVKQQPAVTEEPETPKQASKESQEIVITGSLIRRRDATSSSPISTVDSSVLNANASPSLDRAIGQLPQFSGAQGAAEVGDTQGTIGFA